MRVCLHFVPALLVTELLEVPPIFFSEPSGLLGLYLYKQLQISDCYLRDAPCLRISHTSGLLSNRIIHFCEDMTLLLLTALTAQV